MSAGLCVCVVCSGGCLSALAQGGCLAPTELQQYGQILRDKRSGALSC